MTIRRTKIIFLESKFMKSVLCDKISHSFLALLLNNHFHRLVTGSLIQSKEKFGHLQTRAGYRTKQVSDWNYKFQDYKSCFCQRSLAVVRHKYCTSAIKETVSKYILTYILNSASLNSGICLVKQRSKLVEFNEFSFLL